MVAKPWSQRTKTTPQLMIESSGALAQIPGIRVIPLTPPPLPGGGDFPVDFVIASAAEPEQLVDLAHQLVQKAMASGMFIFADADLKFDQPADRGGVRSRQGALAGGRPEPGGPRPSTLLGGDYVNRFSIQGRSYKVIPQVKRVERLTPDQLAGVYVTGSDRGLVPLSTFATLRTSAQPRELKKFQQLNAVRIQGVLPPPVPLDQALTFLEDGGGGRSCRRASPSTTPASRASCGRKGASSSACSCCRRVLIYLVLAAQFESFRDPFIVLAGSVPLALSGALLFSFLGADDAQHLQPGRADHAGRPGGEERDPRSSSSPTTCRRRGWTSCARWSRRSARGYGRF